MKPFVIINCLYTNYVIIGEGEGGQPKSDRAWQGGGHDLKRMNIG